MTLITHKNGWLSEEKLGPWDKGSWEFCGFKFLIQEMWRLEVCGVGWQVLLQRNT